MAPQTPPTTSELQAAYRRAGLWRIGMAYTDAMGAPLVLWALKKSALARRQRQAIPQQGALV